MRKHTVRGNEGMALFVSLIFLVSMGILATYATTRVMGNARHVDIYVDFQNSFEGLEAGFAGAEVEIEKMLEDEVAAADKDGMIGVDPNINMANGLPTFGMAGVTPVTMSTRPELQYFTFVTDWSTDGLDNNGDGQIDTGPEVNGYWGLYAAARINRVGNVTAIRQAERIIQANLTNVWDNAIFAGSGQAGALINGNVSIHGSVHLLGNDVGVGGLAISALDLSGTSLIHNNYEGLSADLLGRIPGLKQTLVQGELVDTLNAKLRVRHGLVGLSGNSEIGQMQMLGNGFKETMDGVYVTDGWTGTGLDANGDPENVYSDNGWDSPYDGNEELPFPTLEDDNGIDHLAYFLEQDPPGEGFQVIHSGDITIQPGTGSYYWNATTGEEIIGGTPGVGGMPNQGDLQGDEYWVWYDDGPNTMVINGRIAVDGNINFIAGNGGPNSTIDYEGKGTMLAYDGGAGGGNSEISLNLKTDMFPGTNLFGIMADGEMILGQSAQIEIMGGFYARDRVSTDRQTTILGTMVSNLFDMGTNVPDIYQIPALKLAWDDALRMIGSNPKVVVTTVSWMESAAL